ncbi:hypothetical protein WA158_005291 [Blastocystis sp. Blastoise]
MSEERSFVELLLNLAVSAGSIIFSTWLLTKAMDKMDPRNKELKENEERKKKIIDILKTRCPNLKTLTDYEYRILQDIVLPSEIDISFKDIGGLEDVKQEIKDMILLPLLRPDIFKGKKLLEFPKGILLYGPPGTGKTMIGKAIAKESGATFINVQLSSLLNMYVGESEKITRSIFSLAHKLAPSIIFIDEVDILLGTRGSQQNEAYSQIKGEFLQLWDGVVTGRVDGQDNGDNHGNVLIVAATNRPWDVDTAFLRRLPRTFLIDLPDEKQRVDILRKALSDEVNRDILAKKVSKITSGYSGSDLVELCKQAAFYAVQRAFANEKIFNRVLIGAITEEDFRIAQTRVLPTGAAAFNYQFLNQMVDPRKRSQNTDITTPQANTSEDSQDTINNTKNTPLSEDQQNKLEEEELHEIVD